MLSAAQEALTLLWSKPRDSPMPGFPQAVGVPVHLILPRSGSQMTPGGFVPCPGCVMPWGWAHPEADLLLIPCLWELLPYLSLLTMSRSGSPPAYRQVHAMCIALCSAPRMQPDSQPTLPLDINNYPMAKYVQAHFQVRRPGPNVLSTSAPAPSGRM